MPGNPYHGPAHLLDVLQSEPYNMTSTGQKRGRFCVDANPRFLTTLLQETGLATWHHLALSGWWGLANDMV